MIRKIKKNRTVKDKLLDDSSNIVYGRSVPLIWRHFAAKS